MAAKLPGKARSDEMGSCGEAAESAPEELVPLMEGRFGAAWFVMLVGMILTLYFYLWLVLTNVKIIKEVLDHYEGPSAWVKNMAPPLINNVFFLVLGTSLFLVGYSMTLRRRGRFSRERLLLRLFGVGTGLVALALLVLGVDYVFFLKKEMSGFSDYIDIYGVLLSTFLVWFSTLSAFTVYCWMPRRGERK